MQLMERDLKTVPVNLGYSLMSPASKNTLHPAARWWNSVLSQSPELSGLAEAWTLQRPIVLKPWGWGDK